MISASHARTKRRQEKRPFVAIAPTWPHAADLADGAGVDHYTGLARWQRAQNDIPTGEIEQPDLLRLERRAAGVQGHDEERIRRAMQTVAMLMEKEDAYLPIYLRLERELEEAGGRAAALRRARESLRRSP